MIDYLLIAIGGVVMLVAAALVWLLLEYRKLRQDYRLLAEQLKHNQEDVAGLCAAAVAVDQHLLANDTRLNTILDALNAYQPTTQQPASPLPDHDDQPQGYEEVIQKIRRGASAEELVKDCGLTRDEAVLLIRLHG